MNDAQKQKNINEAEVKDRLGQVIRIKDEIGEQIIENQLQNEKKKENQEQKEGEILNQNNRREIQNKEVGNIRKGKLTDSSSGQQAISKSLSIYYDETDELIIEFPTFYF